VSIICMSRRKALWIAVMASSGWVMIFSSDELL
jgi:hypothetical protein